MKIIDCFTFFDEEIILELRLNILYDHVDQFIISEGTLDHRGRVRKTLFDKEKFKKFKDKITYIKVEDFPNVDDPWKMLSYQRNSAVSFLNKFDKEDLILISDVDEIPNLEVIKNFLKSKKKIGFFTQKLFFYKLNLFSNNEEWHGTRICRLKDLKSPDWLRGIKRKKYPWWRIDKETSMTFLQNGGWHFSFMYTPEGISKKFSSYQHLEFDNPDYNNIEIIKSKIAKGEDVLGRGYKFSKIKIDKTFPQYLLNNLEKYKDYIQ